MARKITAEEYEQMLKELENGTFVPTANEGAPKPLYSGYSNWSEFLDCDQLANDEVCSQYVDEITHPTSCDSGLYQEEESFDDNAFPGKEVKWLLVGDISPLNALIRYRGKIGLFFISYNNGMGGDINRFYGTKPYFKYDDVKVCLPHCSMGIRGFIAVKENGTWSILKIYVDRLPVTILHGFSSFEDARDNFERYIGRNSAYPWVSFDKMDIGGYGYNREYTGMVHRLLTHQVFVFGSNIKGYHGGGAARVANKKFGAEWGVGEGMTGQCYALPTMEGGIDYIEHKVDTFIDYAESHPEKEFLVTPIACGIAGFRPSQIAPLFKRAVNIENIILPEEFVRVLENKI